MGDLVELPAIKLYHLLLYLEIVYCLDPWSVADSVRILIM